MTSSIMTRTRKGPTPLGQASAGPPEVRNPWRIALAGAFVASLAFGASLAAADDAPYDEPLPKSETPATVPPQPGETREVEQPRKKGATTREGTDVRKEADGAWVRFISPEIRFEQARFADDARIMLREADGEGWRVHRGRDLDAILSVNPALATRPEIVAMRRQVRAMSTEVPVRADKQPASAFAGMIRTFVDSPGLLLERRGADEVVLYVDDPEGGERAFVAKDLDALVKASPDLEKSEGFPTLRARVRELDAKKALVLKPDALAIVDVHHSGDKVLVTAHRWRDGRWTSDTFRGNSLEEITARETELRGVLDLPDASASRAAASSEDAKAGA